MAKNGTYHDRTASVTPEKDSVGSIDEGIDSAAITRYPAAQIIMNREARIRSAICRRTLDDAAMAIRKGTASPKVATRRADIQGRPGN